MSAAGPILNYTPLSAGTSDVHTPFPASGHFYYWPFILNLTGGQIATDLDAQNISILPDDSLIEVKIAGRGASQWLRVFNATPTSSNAASGIIVPTNYDAIARPYMLMRQLGF